MFILKINFERERGRERAHVYFSDVDHFFEVGQICAECFLHHYSNIYV